MTHKQEYKNGDSCGFGSCPSPLSILHWIRNALWDLCLPQVYTITPNVLDKSMQSKKNWRRWTVDQHIWRECIMCVINSVTAGLTLSLQYKTKSNDSWMSHLKTQPHLAIHEKASDGKGSSFYCTESLESIHQNDSFKRFVHRIVQCSPTPWTDKQPNDLSFSSWFSPEVHVHLLRDGAFTDYSTQSFAGDAALLWVVYMH